MNRRQFKWSAGIFLTISILILSFSCHKQRVSVAWRRDVFLGLEQAKRLDKPVLMNFTAIWCPYCQAMKDSVWSNPLVIETTKAFIPVWVDVDSNKAAATVYHASARKYGGIGIPNMLFLDAQGDSLLHLVGFHSADSLVYFMNRTLDQVKNQ